MPGGSKITNQITRSQKRPVPRPPCTKGHGSPGSVNIKGRDRPPGDLSRRPRALVTTFIYGPTAAVARNRSRALSGGNSFPRHDATYHDARVSASVMAASATGWASEPTSADGRTSRSTVSVSAATNPACARTAPATVPSAPTVSRIRSETARPASRRACCTIRTTSRAVPSAASSGVTRRSSAISPALPGSADVESGSAAASRSSYSPGSRRTPAASTNSPDWVQAPALTARMTCCTCPPSRGPSTRGLTASSNVPRLAGSAESSTVLTFTSSEVSETNGASDLASGWATTSDASGSRTRSWCALRSPSAVLHTARARSMAPVSSSSSGLSSAQSDTSGHDARCTLAPPVSPRQIASAVSGSNGAAARDTVSSTVHSVSSAARSPAQNRLRERRMYQLVSTSRWSRSAWHAPPTSYPSSAAAISVTAARVLARMYRSSTCPDATDRPASYDSALAYKAKKYQQFHSGRMACLTASLMPCSVTIRLPPRSTGLDIRNQRIASEPNVSNTLFTSG